MKLKLIPEERAVMLRPFPNMQLLSDADLSLAIAGMVKVGRDAESCGATLVNDFFSRCLLVLELERERRGFDSYNELLQSSMAAFVEEHGDNIAGKIN